MSVEYLNAYARDPRNYIRQLQDGGVGEGKSADVVTQEVKQELPKKLKK